MLSSVKTFVSTRRQGLTKAAGIVGGLYLVRQYITDRLDEVKNRLEEEKVARDVLKRRFDQTQEDISYTVLALIPTLAEQVLGQMDVEGLTKELQSRSRARKAARALGPGSGSGSGQTHEETQVQEQAHEGEGSRPPSSLASSVDVVGRMKTASEAGSSLTSSYHVAERSEGASESVDGVSASGVGLGSWVEAGAAQGPFSNVGVEVRELVLNGDALSVTESAMTDSVMSSSFTSDASSTRTTADLWNEVKILTFTRTLTTLYSTTLLSLFTALQLTLLARSKYVQSIIAKERDERMRETLEAQFSIANILLGRTAGLEELMSGDMSSLLGDEGGDGENEVISEEVESMFLTMSWWMLHVGWKDVGERVRRGVEEVFDGVSLKSKLAAIDLHRLVGDVRRRVEHEVTFEGQERRINFLSSLLPSTLETVQHVLTQGGFPSRPPYTHLDLLEFDDASVASSLSLSLPHSHPPTSPSPTPLRLNLSGHPTPPPLHHNPSFAALLAETHTTITSPDFAHVLEACLDRATGVLVAGLEREVFVSSSDPPPAPGEPVRIRLAGMLPGLARWSERALCGLPNELVDSLLDLREVECLSAIVFARFEERFR
ncbi:Peroxin-3 [Collybia nuda]|uniref:Peroxin-3 n=1 Tax=Collybia nuda TaxID=64659 RepID=A0A9P5Y4F3_9AGAR|nr:Peroxin-3 [Collybia nuda]